MKTIKKIRLFCLSAVLTIIVLLVSCASMYIHGSNPVQRAISAANLIIGGNTSDSYIKVYKTEAARAESTIINMISKAERNNIYYADIADNVSDWILLYRQVSVLQRMYPEGLSGKKEFVIFEAKDYSGLKERYHILATEALYNEAVRIIQTAGTDYGRTEKVLANLKRAKKYSRHLDNEINSLGAEVAYNAAELLSNTDKPKKLLQASEYYMLANSWFPGYRGSLQKADNAKQKAAYLYIEEGSYNLRLKDYTAFRQAKRAYQNAEKIIPGIASGDLAEVNRRLTIRLAIVPTINTYGYTQEDRIIRAVQSEIYSSKSGPEIVEISFIRNAISSIFNFIDVRNADLVFVPSENYGKIKEAYGPVNTVYKNVSKVINGILYNGVITEQTQSVTVYSQNDFILYDIRGWRRKELHYFNNTSDKSSKTFTLRYYNGDPQARPDNFDAGFLYKPGQYKKFFPELMQKNDSLYLVTNYGTLTRIGKELCNIIERLQYVERQ